MDKTHRNRILTALVALPILIWIILWAPFFIFTSFVFLIGFLASFEHCRLWKVPHDGLLFLYTLFLSLIVLVAYAIKSPVFGLTLAFFFLAIYFIWAYGHKPELASFLPATSLNLVYPALLLGHAFSFLSLPQGRFLLLWTLLIVFASDTGAFYIGCNFGKHKLYPAVSPKKSWEGLGGALGAAVILGVITAYFLPISPFKTVFLAFMLALTEQTGDFFESVIKRHVGCKDSGQILPGHGGLLDRIDGVLFALPVSYYCWQWFLGK
ncbi:MAG: phosphatidate cytidylyltransferase [Candidatus Desulfofervidaceae bacterium]|nr:phosphatidate cytidylyltransferase [Candidatus Desulfofervidaceae bacterium]